VQRRRRVAGGAGGGAGRADHAEQHVRAVPQVHQREEEAGGAQKGLSAKGGQEGGQRGRREEQ